MPIEEFPIPPGGVGGAMVESRPTQIVLLGNVPHYNADRRLGIPSILGMV